MKHLNQSDFSSDLPYPEIRAERPNTAYARMMLDNLAGVNSEMSSVSLYLYNSMITCDRDGLSDIFRKFSIVEMHHLDIFGCLALQLGGNPRLWVPDGEQMTYWSPGYNQYPRDLHGLILNASRGEEQTLCKYRRQASQIQDAHIVEILNRIIADEEIHLRIFRQLYERYFRK